MSLSAKQVSEVAQLARLDLTADEVSTMTRQLTAILAYVEQVMQVDTQGSKPLEHPLPLENVFRADQLHESLSPEAALANAPDRRNHFFGVPAVLE